MQIDPVDAARAAADEESSMKALLDKAIVHISGAVSRECHGRSMGRSSVDVVFTRTDGRVSFPTEQCVVPRQMEEMSAEQLGAMIVDGLGQQALEGECAPPEFEEACRLIALRMVEQAAREHRQEA